MDVETWKELASDHDLWKHELYASLQRRKAKLKQSADEKYTQWKNNQRMTPAETNFKCSLCNKDCHYHVGIYSHSRHCSSVTRNNDTFSGRKIHGLSRLMNAEADSIEPCVTPFIQVRFIYITQGSSRCRDSYHTKPHHTLCLWLFAYNSTPYEHSSN